MEKDRIIKQITITERDIVDLVQSELYNTGLMEDMEKQEIKQLNSLASFELTQSYCDNNIETVLRSFKTVWTIWNWKSSNTGLGLIVRVI